MSLKLGAMAIIVGLLLAVEALPPVVVAGGLVLVLVSLAYAEGVLLPLAQSIS